MRQLHPVHTFWGKNTRFVTILRAGNSALISKEDARSGQYGGAITMNLYLDTVNVKEIQDAASLGVSGVGWMKERLGLAGEIKRANTVRCKNNME